MAFPSHNFIALSTFPFKLPRSFRRLRPASNWYARINLICGVLIVIFLAFEMAPYLIDFLWRGHLPFAAGSFHGGSRSPGQPHCGHG